MPRRNQSMKCTTSSTVTPRATLGAITVPMSMSMLPVPSDLSSALHQPMPPNTITAGKESAIRSSSAASIIVCVPPPLAPVAATRVGSTSGRDNTKSTLRSAFQVCSPITDCRRASAGAL